MQLSSSNPHQNLTPSKPSANSLSPSPPLQRLKLTGRQALGRAQLLRQNADHIPRSSFENRKRFMQAAFQKGEYGRIRRIGEKRLQTLLPILEDLWLRRFAGRPRRTAERRLQPVVALILLRHRAGLDERAGGEPGESQRAATGAPNSGC